MSERDFPRILYKDAKTYLTVHSKDELKAALADGWFLTREEAVKKASKAAKG